MTKFIAVVSGKGGVGKTTATINIGQALTDLGKNVVLLDANLMTPNVAVQLGLIDPDGTLNKFLRKEKSLKEIIYLHESGLSVIPASPSYCEFQKTNAHKVTKVFEKLDDTADFVMVDAPSGLGQELNYILKNCDEALIVVNPNLSSVLDALKTIQLATANETIITGIILNMSNGGRYELKAKEIEETLGFPILANVQFHQKVRKALHRNMPLNYLYPRSKPAREFGKAAEFLSLYQTVE